MRNKGFIQIPVLIVIVVGVIIASGAGYVGINKVHKEPIQKIADRDIDTEIENPEEILDKATTTDTQKSEERSDKEQEEKTSDTRDNLDPNISSSLNTAKPTANTNLEVPVLVNLDTNETSETQIQKDFILTCEASDENPEEGDLIKIDLNIEGSASDYEILWDHEDDLDSGKGTKSASFRFNSSGTKKITAKVTRKEDGFSKTATCVIDVEEEAVIPPPPQSPEIEVKITADNFGSDGKPPEISGRKFIFLQVNGDWEKSYARLWDPDGNLLIGSGYNEPYDIKKTGQLWPYTLSDTTGHFYEINNVPAGQYKWEVYAKKNDIEEIKSGTFTVEPPVVRNIDVSLRNHFFGSEGHGIWGLIEVTIEGDELDGEIELTLTPDVTGDYDGRRYEMVSADGDILMGVTNASAWPLTLDAPAETVTTYYFVYAELFTELPPSPYSLSITGEMNSYDGFILEPNFRGLPISVSGSESVSCAGIYDCTERLLEK